MIDPIVKYILTIPLINRTDQTNVNMYINLQFNSTNTHPFRYQVTSKFHTQKKTVTYVDLTKSCEKIIDTS